MSRQTARKRFLLGTALTSGMDVRPTLEELCGLKSVKRAAEDGKSLVPLIRGDTPGWIDRVICLDLQKQQQTPQKENPHTVMQGNWRWLDGELHNLDDDPGQLKDVQSKHPDRVRRMQAAYDDWWKIVNPDDPAAGHEIVIGSARANPTTLTTHDISGDVAWNHDQVLAGYRATGYWEIEVAQTGGYEFALRRYPAEAAEPILGTIPIPEKLKNFHYFVNRYKYAETHDRSKGVPVASASLKIGSFRAEKSLPVKTVASADYQVNAQGDVLAVIFTANLKAGITKLEAAFLDKAGKHLTAPYYITVTRK